MAVRASIVVKSGLMSVGQKQMDKFSLVIRFNLLSWLTLWKDTNTVIQYIQFKSLLRDICELKMGKQSMGNIYKRTQILQIKRHTIHVLAT